MDADSAPSATRRPISPASLDPDAYRVVERLAREGFVTYVVGGCVRDLLPGIRPKDFDIATAASPRQVKRVFRNSRIIGRRFRLVHVHFGPHVVEVATFRAPPEREVGVDPLLDRDNVFGSETDDAFRRDFTINALFYDPVNDRLIDHVGGLADLDARVLRTIGDAETRIREDPVRILRAAKFAGRLGFQLDPDLRRASARHVEDLRKSAPPRVLEEWFRLLANRGSSQSFHLLDELGVLSTLLPEILPLPAAFFAALESLEELTGGSRDGADQALLLSVLFAPAVLPGLTALEGGDPEAFVRERIHGPAVRLTVSRRDQALLRILLAAQLRFLEPPETRGAARFARRDLFPLALELRRLLGPLQAVEGDPLPLWEELERSERAHREGPRSGAGRGGGEGPGEPRRKRRRRRGGRRRRRGSAAPGGA